MRLASLYCTLTLAVVVAGASAADLPSTPVFTAGLQGITCYRIPAVVQTARGVLLAFAEARHGSCGDSNVVEIAQRRSTDGGATWEDGATFPVGNASYMVGNPTAVARADGAVVVVFVRHDPKCRGGCGIGNGIVMSYDDGQTWTDPHNIGEEFGPAKGGLPGPGTALELSPKSAYQGRLLVVSHKGAYVNDWVSISDDGGTTWKTNARPFPTMDEAALTELPDGAVLLNMRHRNSPAVGRAVAVSHDGGETFGNITYDKALVSPVCQASIVSFDGATFFSNPADTHGRDKISIKRSDDGASTWDKTLLVHAESTFGYSCLVKGELVQGPAGQGGLLFESADTSIAFSRFNLNLTTSV